MSLGNRIGRSYKLCGRLSVEDGGERWVCKCLSTSVTLSPSNAQAHCERLVSWEREKLIEKEMFSKEQYLRTSDFVEKRSVRVTEVSLNPRSDSYL